jgi:GTP1/Obg family GTP-binding protein
MTEKQAELIAEVINHQTAAIMNVFEKLDLSIAELTDEVCRLSRRRIVSRFED